MNHPMLFLKATAKVEKFFEYANNPSKKTCIFPSKTVLLQNIFE
jgi:hypothetical protein